MTRKMITITMTALLWAACGDDATAPVSTDAGAAEPWVVTELDGAAFELPESLAFHDGKAYATFLGGSVVTVDAAGAVSPFGSVAIDPAGSAYALGIAVGPDGAVYVAMAKAAADSAFASGVYRIAPSGGAGTLLASHDELWIPNDLDLDADGNVYVTADGRIYRVASGAAEIWKEDPLLASSDGTAAAPCGVRTSPFPIGANGIEVEDGRVVVANTESGSLLAVPIEADGSAGEATALVTDTARLCGIDGLVGDADGSYLATVLGTTVSRISGDGADITVVHAGLPLRSPAGIDVGTFGGVRSAIVSSPDFEEAFGPGGPPSAMPNIAALPL